MNSVWIVTIEHRATKFRYTIPVLAETLSDAESKATDWPYSSDAFFVVKI